MPPSNQPQMCLVQVSSRAWGGSADSGMACLEDIPYPIHTLRRLQDVFPNTPLCLIAPDFDRSAGLENLLQEYSMHNVTIVYGAAASPLKRMVQATQALAESAPILRINGENLFTHPRSLRDLMALWSDTPHCDGVKFSDDYPAKLTADIYRVGALRQALALLPQENAFHVHVKHFMAHHPSFQIATLSPTLYYTDDEMRSLRHALNTGLGNPEPGIGRLLVDHSLSIPQGDQLSFHYEKALDYIEPGSDVLDIACGPGYGAKMLAQKSARVFAGDIDETMIQQVRHAYKDEPAIVFDVMDATKLPLKDNQVDAITSFETIEHMTDLDGYLQELNRVLKPKGLVMISTPQNGFGSVPLTVSHFREFSYPELKHIIESTFDIVEFIGIKQGRIYFPNDPIGNNSLVIARSRK